MEGVITNLEKLRSLINSYVIHVENNFNYHIKEEGYKFKEAKKFQDNFDISSLEVFKAKIDVALTKTNLIISAYYYPRRVFLKFLEIDAEFVYQEVKKLLDEEKDLASRINEFKEAFAEKIKDLREKGLLDEKYRQTYMDLRFISYLLASYYPEKYVYYKSGEYRIFLEKIEVGKIQGKSNGERYHFLLQYANLVRNELKKNKRYLTVHKKFVEETGYSDENLSWGAWDFIFGIKFYSLSPPSGEDKLLDLLAQKSQIIFYGPPGTGKTYKAREFVVEFLEEQGGI